MSSRLAARSSGCTVASSRTSRPPTTSPRRPDRSGGLNQLLRLHVHQTGCIMSSDHRARRRGQPAVSARSDASPVAKADLPGQTIWTWLETAALPEALVLPFRIAVNLAGAVSAAFFARATLQFYWRKHSLIGGALLVQQTWLVIAYLVRRPARGLLPRPVGVHWHWGVGAGLGLQLAGIAVCVLSLLVLGRSFGLVAADRVW